MLYICLKSENDKKQMNLTGISDKKTIFKSW